MGKSGTVRRQNRKAPLFRGGRYRFKHAKVGNGVKQSGWHWATRSCIVGETVVEAGRVEHLPCRTVGGAWEGWLLCIGMMDAGRQERM